VAFAPVRVTSILEDEKDLIGKVAHEAVKEAAYQLSESIPKK